MRERDAEILVLGAGVAGLAAALMLEARGRDVLLIDAADAPGGVMRSDRVGGFLVERGPNTIQVKPPLRALLAEQGLEAALTRAAPESRRRCLVRGGRLIPVPMNPLSFATTPLLSARAKWRLLGEPFVRSGDPSTESVSEFIGRRLGEEVVSSLV
ncbi:MAG: FAD-dependent oxidoreductase, partial [Myxococcota bacterium]